ncbi:MAG: type II secretion system protein GspG [Deltaproteobacteria bacterium]|nr:type II secretion system protein GspG [Candidatus Anaeroferrophillacea bacterium]
MVELIRQLLVAGIAMGLLAGNADTIKSFYDDTVHLARRISTAGDLRSIGLMLDRTCLKHGRAPSARGFDAWLAANFKESDSGISTAGTDAWGNRLVYRTFDRRRAYLIISAGPDGIADTADDIRRSGP